PWKIKLITEPFFLVNLWKKVRNVENLIKEKPGLLSGTLSTVWADTGMSAFYVSENILYVRNFRRKIS
ncbi:hypothetical protein, partial [Clostridium porci]|uniref:hypothetical protein n=1 Tax=Clostridium porci TaxID=2605778 RepID=UPI001A9BBD37